MNKPMRKRVEVIIVNAKTNKVLVTVNVGDRDPRWYGFPGGGIEDNQTRAEAAIAECREEVQCVVMPGRVISQHTEIGYKSGATKRYREDMYSGSVTEYVVAQLVKEHSPADHSDGDETDYQWMTLHEAIALFSRLLNPTPVGGITPACQTSAGPRLKALKAMATA